jgi:hypothetical protein
MEKVTFFSLLAAGMTVGLGLISSYLEKRSRNKPTARVVKTSTQTPDEKLSEGIVIPNRSGSGNVSFGDAVIGGLSDEHSTAAVGALHK